MKKSLYRAVKRMREFSEINQEFLSETRAGIESAETTNETIFVLTTQTKRHIFK